MVYDAKTQRTSNRGHLAQIQEASKELDFCSGHVQVLRCSALERRRGQSGLEGASLATAALQSFKGLLIDDDFLSCKLKGLQNETPSFSSVSCSFRLAAPSSRSFHSPKRFLFSRGGRGIKRCPVRPVLLPTSTMKAE